MPSSFFNNSVRCTVLFILIFITLIKAENTTITIPLNKTITEYNKELYNKFINVNSNSTIQVNFVNVNGNVSFIIFQVHSHIYNVTLYNKTLNDGSYVSGTNLGLYSSVKPALDAFYILNPNSIDLKLYISVHGYKDRDPIPGGCNMELPVSISPFLLTPYKKDYIFVEAGSPKKYNDTGCDETNLVNIAFYMMYLPEKNFEADTYFEGIQKMMSLDKIRENGILIPETLQLWHMRRLISAYPGTGSIYVAVAHSEKDHYSVYVPAQTYACAPEKENGCELLDNALSQILCALLIFVGLFVCYFGHRFFKTEMFIIGMTSGVIITYILISLLADMDGHDLLGVSILSGLFFGAIWLVFWWIYGIPLFAVMLPTLNVGFLCASIAYYRFPGHVTIFRVDYNFWSLFIMMMVLISLALLSATTTSNILSCALLGAYAAVYPIDYYIGSNLKYIIINTLRRATVPLFENAVLMPPFQIKDVIVTLLWITLAISGFIYQSYYSKGRPPFPPPDRTVTPVPQSPRYGATDYERVGSRSSTADERTPLLS